VLQDERRWGTDGNTASEALFASLGFERLGVWDA
jgi:hypothetical protein